MPIPARPPLEVGGAAFPNANLPRVSTTLPPEVEEGLLAGLPSGSRPADPLARQPVHSVYGGAHLFRADLPRKLGDLALRALHSLAPGPEELARAMALDLPAAREVWPRLQAKLEREPVEDYRIDFEDGYGVRSHQEEDGHALEAGENLARALEAGSLPPRIGIRLRAMNRETGARALRTLDLVLTRLVSRAGALPPDFVVTLPKVEEASAPRVLVAALERLEAALGLRHGAVGVELMVESPLGLEPRTLRANLAACRGRCLAVHLGANDFLSACGVGPSDQDLGHPACDHARMTLHQGVAGTEVRLVDGTTTVLPVPLHRGEDLLEWQRQENREAVFGAWGLHAADVRRGLRQGFHQGWDLHPAQLVSRYAAVYGWYRAGLEPIASRLGAFLESSARASLVGTAFDDAASGRALLAHFLRALDCGAVDEAEVRDRTGLAREELVARSFPEILARRA